MKKTKIVVIGAGSASFGLTNLGAILRTSALKGSELGLVDINEEGLDLITKLAERLNKEWGSEFKITSSTKRKELLKDADFVIISVAIDREKCWNSDFEIAKKHGIMHYAENGGPGGAMHASRNINLIMPILRDIEAICPSALVLNFTNPVPRICIAAARFTKLKMVGICHQIEFGYSIVAKVLAKDLGLDIPAGYKFKWQEAIQKQYHHINEIAQEKIDILAAGINHFSWMLAIRDRKTGADLYPLFRERYHNGFEDFEPLTREVFDIFKTCPVPGDCHMVEYLPYTHNMNTNTWDKYDVQMYPLHQAEQDRFDMWDEIAEMADGKKSVDHLRNVHSERSEMIISDIITNAYGYEQAVNIPNLGYIENLPYNAIVEVPAVVSANGIHGVGVGKMPEVAAEMCRRQINLAEMVVEAAVKGDKDLMLQALAMDPMVDDPKIARALLDDYLKANREYLPQFFDKNVRL
jgi:alpha-galactosidase